MNQACRLAYRAYPFRSGKRRFQDTIRRFVFGTSIERRAGFRYLLDLDNLIDLYIFFDGAYEAEVTTLLKDLATRFESDVFVDVGCNIGCHAMAMTAGTQVQKVIGFEPDPRNRAQLLANLWLNNLVQRVEVHEEALSSSSGTAEFHLAYFRPRKFGEVQFNTMVSGLQTDHGGGNILVRKSRFDDVVSLEGRRVLLKIDVEGHELEVLRGMEQLLARNQCVVMVEDLSPHGESLEGVRAFLGGFGYEPTGWRVDANHVFAHAGAVSRG